MQLKFCVIALFIFDFLHFLSEPEFSKEFEGYKVHTVFRQQHVNNEKDNQIWTILKKVDSLADILKENSEFQTQVNLHYSCNHTKPTDPKGREFDLGEWLFWDIDDIGETNPLLFSEMLSSIIGVHRDNFYVIHSGNGCHLLLQVPTYNVLFFEAAKPYYREISKRLMQTISESKLEGSVDLVFNKGKSLRVPGTVNRKPDRPDTKCRLVQTGKPTSFNLLSWGSSTEQVQTIPEQSYSVDLSALQREKAQFPEPDLLKNQGVVQTVVPLKLLPKRATRQTKSIGIFSEAVKQCGFLQTFRDQPESLHRTMWLAGVSTLTFLGSEGTKAAHEWSAQDTDRYSADEVDRIIEGSKGPWSCDTIATSWQAVERDANLVSCAKCSLKGKCHSPARIVPEGMEAMYFGFYQTKRKDGMDVKTLNPNYLELSKYLKHTQNILYVQDNHEFYSWDTDEQQYEARGPEGISKLALDLLDPPLLDPSPMLFKMPAAVKMLNSQKLEDMMPQANLVPFANGMLNPMTGSLAPYTPEIFLTRKFQASYIPASQAPIFTDWLLERLDGNTELVEVIKDYMAYAMMGSEYPNRSILILEGQRRTGKSTLLQLLKEIFGDCGAWSTIDALTSRFGDAELLEKRVAIYDEASPFQDSKLIEKLKTLSGTKYLRVEEKGKQAYDALNHARLVISCNEVPRSGASDAALLDRLLIIPFKRFIESKDPFIEAKILESRDLIASEIAERIPRLVANRLEIKQPDAMKQALNEYQLDNDPVADFLENECEFLPIGTMKGFFELPDLEQLKFTALRSDKGEDGEPRAVALARLYEVFTDWAEEEGLKYVMSRKQFKKRMVSLFSSRNGCGAVARIIRRRVIFVGVRARARGAWPIYTNEFEKTL